MTDAVIAVVFDFDDTLTPDTTTKLLRAHGIDADRFWKNEVGDRVNDGWDPALAWLGLVLENVGEGKPLGKLTNADLGELGASLDGEFFEGLPQMFDDLRALVAGYRDIQVEFYVISGGLKELLTGSSIVKKHFRAVYGSQLGEGPAGFLQYVKRAVTFTEKTRYLFEIHKGLRPEDTANNPYLVNSSVVTNERRVPFSNMLYIGDGLTDIPCFSLVRKEGGTAFGVFDPERTESAKRAFVEFLRPHRVVSVHSPRYGPKDDLGSLIRAGVAATATRIQVRRQTA